MILLKKIMINDEGIDLERILANVGDILDEVNDDIVNIQSSTGDNVRIYIEK